MSVRTRVEALERGQGDRDRDQVDQEWGPVITQIVDRLFTVATQAERDVLLGALVADLDGVEVDQETAELADAVWSKITEGVEWTS